MASPNLKGKAEASFFLPDLNPVEHDIYRLDTEIQTGISGGFELPPLDGDSPEAKPIQVLRIDDADLSEPAASSSWKPGQDVGGFVARRWRPLVSQAQVLVCNLVINLHKLPKDMLQRMLQHLQASKRTVKSRVMAVAGSLLRLPSATVMNCYRRLKLNQWKPSLLENVEQCADKGRKDTKKTEDSDDVIMQRLVREALHSASSGQSDMDFIRAISRFELAGVNMGSKYHTRHFVSLVEYVAAVALQVCDASEFNQPLQSHGMQSMCSVGFDIGNLGRAMFSKHECLDLPFHLMLLVPVRHTALLQS